MPAISPRRMWTPEQITAMRQAYRDGVTFKAMAAQFGGRDSNLIHAIRGITYRDIPGWIRQAEMRKPRRAAI